MALVPLHGRDHAPGAPDPIPGGPGIYAIELFEINEAVVTGPCFEWEIPEDLDNSDLVKVEAYVTTASSSGLVQVSIYNETQAHGMLSTPVSIDVGDLNSKDATTPAVVGSPNVAWGDHLRVDVDGAGTGATGLGLVCYFKPLWVANIAVQGAKGDPGGVTAWQGGWAGGSTYTTGQSVSDSGSTYVARTDVPAGVQPGVTAGWQTYWQLLSEGNRASSIELVVNGNGFVIDTGVKGYIHVPFNCTIQQVQMFADQAGSIVVDIYKDVYANHPPLANDSITGGNPPTITADVKMVDAVLSGWTKTITQDDILAFHVDSCSLIQRLTLSLVVLR